MGVSLAGVSMPIFMVALLLQYGADPALRDREGRTAADLAREAGHNALARRLSTDSEAERIVW